MKTRSIWSAWFILLLSVLCFPARAQVQCDRGWAGQANGLPGGTVFATTSWDPDGSGTLPSALVVGGSFQMAADIPALNVAYWDGAAWHSLGLGLNGTVRALAVLNGTLYAGGDFTASGSTSIHYFAKWTGNAWAEVTFGTDGPVFALTLNGSELLIGGSFTHTAGGLLPFAHLARYSAAGWDGYLNEPTLSVMAVQVLGGQPIVVEFGNKCAGAPDATHTIERYDGNYWNVVECLTYWNGSFFAYNGSVFYSSLKQDLNANGSCRYTREYIISRYDGTIHQNNLYHGAYSFAVYNGQLYALGFARTICQHAVGPPAGDWIGSWNGSTWTDHSDLSPHTTPLLTSHNNSLFVAGTFSLVGNNSQANSIAQLVGTSWVALAPQFDSTARAVTVQGSTAFVGGDFTRAGSLGAGRIAAFNGTYWYAVGDCDAPVRFLGVQAYNPLAINSSLIISGDFTHVGASAFSHIVQRSSLNGAYSALGAGLDATVRAIIPVTTSVGHADMVVGGDFTLAGGVSAPYIARWTGGAWVTAPFGTGMNAPVLALAGYSGVVAGGSFTLAGGTPRNYIARWDGSAWQPLGAGFNAPVRALAGYGGKLVAAGDFTASGATPLAHIASWDGSAWSPLGAGVDASVNALGVAGPVLFAGGVFTHAGGNAANRVAQWDGSQWSAVGGGAGAGGGTDGPVLGLAIGSGDLYVAGSFLHAGLQNTAYVARAPSPGDLSIVTQPQPTSTCPGAAASFTMKADPGGWFISADYTWYHDGYEVKDGASVSGTFFSGATTPTLELANVAPADAGGYWCKVTTGCGQTSITNTASLDVGGPTCCLADLTHDGTVDLSDFFQFFNCFDATDPCADLDGNPGVDLNDFFAFFNAWANGC